MKTLKYILIIQFLILACEKPDLSRIPNRSSNNNLQGMVSMPAGSAKNYIYDSEKRAFKIFRKEGIHKQMDFLPAPFNLGFIPSTKYKSSYLELIILAESYDMSELVEIEVLGGILCNKNGNERVYILANPLSNEKKLFDVNNIKELADSNIGVVNLINNWIELYDSNDIVRLINKDESLKIIESSLID